VTQNVRHWAWPATRYGNRIVPARCISWHRLGPVSLDSRADSWTPGSGSMSGDIWIRAARPIGSEWAPLHGMLRSVFDFNDLL